MIRRLLIFWGGCAAFTLLVAIPLRLLLEDPAQGSAAVGYSLTALLLCVLPASLTLFWSSRALDRDPQQAILLALGGTGIRMFFVLVAGLGLYQMVPYFKTYGPFFWVVVLIFYLFTLALEMTILLAGRSQSQASVKEPQG